MKSDKINNEFPSSDYFMQIAFNIGKGIYQRLGEGSSRAVFDLGNGKVVKAAKNEKGIAQNTVELQITVDDQSGIFARVRGVSEDFRYLIMDKAISVEDISYVWNYYKVRNNRELYRKLGGISSKYNLLVRDFGRSVNWGQINGKPIIVDYGFTRQVNKKYYRVRRSRSNRNFPISSIK